jgi:AcrR family transcriptional regulator
MSVSTSKLATAPRNRRSNDSRVRLLAAARKLFVERGYHATRPQDISREAGLGHGTFYLHFPDKKSCFLVFAEQARDELDAHLKARAAHARDLPTAVRAVLEGTHEYSLAHPGVLDTAMMDSSVIGADGDGTTLLVDLWAREWAAPLRAQYGVGGELDHDDAGIIGAAIVGMIHEGSAYGRRHGKSPERVFDLLTRLILRALR